jgi:exonuclease I
MILKEKTVFVYDIEVFPNLFTCAIKNTESKRSVCYEISERRNDMPQIARLFLNKTCCFCGYNIIHYDSPIISFILLNYYDLIQKPV